MDQQQRLAKAMSDIANRELMENPAMEKVMRRKNQGGLGGDSMIEGIMSERKMIFYK